MIVEATVDRPPKFPVNCGGPVVRPDGVRPGHTGKSHSHHDATGVFFTQGPDRPQIHATPMDPACTGSPVVARYAFQDAMVTNTEQDGAPNRPPVASLTRPVDSIGSSCRRPSLSVGGTVASTFAQDLTRQPPPEDANSIHHRRCHETCCRGSQDHLPRLQRHRRLGCGFRSRFVPSVARA